MSNLGTLSFDVDLDLSKLQSKIDTQNKAIKDALEGLQVSVASKSVGELAQQIQSELNKHQFSITLDQNQLSGLKSDIVSIAEKSKEIAEIFARMGHGGGGTQQAVKFDLSKFNGISEIIVDIEKEMKRLYNVFADTTDGSGKKVAGLITNLSLLKDALEQLGTAAKNFTPTQKLNEAVTAAQNVATATQNAAKATKTASDEATEATKKQNIETERQFKLQAQVKDLLARVGNLPQNKGISNINTQLTNLFNNLKEIPPTKSLQELSAEFARIKASAKDMLAAETAMNTVRNAIKLINEQIKSGNGSQHLEELRQKLIEVIKEMNAFGKQGNYAKVLDIFKGDQGLGNGALNTIREVRSEFRKIGQEEEKAQIAAEKLAQAIAQLSTTKSTGTLFSSQNTEEIRKQIDAIGALYMRIKEIQGIKVDSPKSWDQLLWGGNWKRYEGSYQEQMEVFKQTFQRVQKELSDMAARGLDISGYQNQLNALYETYEKFAALQPINLTQKLGLENLRGYTGPMFAIDDLTWAKMQRQAEIQEVAREAAEQHRRKLEELTNAFAAHDAQIEKSNRIQANYNQSRQEATAALRKQSEELVKSRMDVLKSQEQQLSKLLSSGKDALGAEQYDAVRNALRGVREEMRQIETLMQNMSSYSIRDLFTAGRGGMNYTPLITHATQELAKNTAEKNKNTDQTSHLSAEEQKLAQSIQQSTNSMRGQSQILSDLKTMAMQYLSVWGAQSFIHNIIQTGGLLEQQRMSIGAILGDLSQANHLFGQIQQLALKSPFGVVQLDTMSKQLTAYNFKYSELYDWTKRLADISAATGTEVSRLSLALGHVRSEGALSGYTLRQFAMGNVPLLQTLAQQLGKTTSEIRKMTREKAITYDDVEKALRTLTDEGGIFFNAQEVMSNALNAKFKNMHDAFDIMFGKMAESDAVGGSLKKVAELMTVLAKNWEQTGAVILSVAGYLGIHKLAMIASNKAMVEANVMTGQYTAKQLEALSVTGSLTKEQMLRAFASSKMSLADAQAAKEALNLTNAQLLLARRTGDVQRAMTMATVATSKYSVAQLRMFAMFRNFSLFSISGFFKGIASSASAAAMSIGKLAKAFAPMLIITAIVEGITYFTQKSDEAKERLEDLSNTANEAAKNLSEASKKFGIGSGDGLSDSELSSGIDEMVEHLKNYSKTAKDTFNNAFAVDAEGKAIHSLKEQYDILAKALSDTASSYNDLNKMKNMVEQAIEAGNGDKGILDTLFGWMLPNSEKAYTLNLKESVEYYVESLNEASKAEQKFLRNRLDIVAVLKNMGIDNAADMTNEQILSKITEWMTVMPSKFKEFKSQLEGDTEDTFSVVLDKWDELGIASAAATDRMKKSGEDFYESAKVFWGEDMQKWPEGWQNTVMLALDAATKDVNGFANMSQEAQNDIKNIWLQPFKITVDSSEAQQQVNNLLVELENLVGHKWIVNIGIKGVSSIDDVKSASKAYTEAVDAVADTTQRLTKLEKEGKKSTEAYTKTLKDQQDAIAKRDAAQATLNAYGADTPKSKKEQREAKQAESDAKKAQREAINNIKEQIEEVKKFYAEYKKYSKVYGEEKGQSMVEELFGIDHEKANEIISDYKGMLEKLAQQLEANKDKKGALSVRQFIAEIDLNDAKEIAESTLNKLGKELEAQAKRWDLYKRILDATGNKEQASTIAFGKLINFDNFGQDLRDQITKALESVPKAKGKSIDELLDMDSKQLEKLDIFKDSTNNIYNLLEKLRDAEQSLKAEEVDLFLNALNNAKSLETELEQIRLKYDKTREAINKNQNLSQEEKFKLISIADKNESKEIAGAQWKNFKETEEWGRIFGNLDKVTTATLTGMRDNLIALLPSVKDNVEATKALYEALDKIDKAVSNRNPFKAISEGLSNASKIKKLMKQLANGDVVGTELGKLLGVNPNTVVDDKVRKQANDAVQAAQDDFVTGLKGVAEKFADVQAVLQPVIDLFETLGNTSITQFFQMGSNALGSAASAASAMSSLGLESAAPYVAGAAAGLSVISSLIAMHDQALQEEIDASKARVKVIENLSKGLEKAFERTLNALQNVQASEKEKETLRDYADKYDLATNGGTFDVPLFDIPLEAIYGYISKETKDAIDKALKTGSYYDTKLAELLIQRDEIQKQLNAEKNKRDSDAGAISDYEAQLEELEDQIQNFAIDMAKVLYDIDIKSWASELTDAVVEAWENGEDAADAYKKKVQDMMKDLLKTILAQRIMEQAFENAGISDLIKNLMTGSTGNLDENAVMQIADALGTASEEGTKAITAILDKLEELGYISKEEAEETAANIDTIKNAFSDLLSDPTQNIEEWGKNFRNSLIQELVKNMLLGEEFEKWAADWNERVTNLWNAYNKGEISKDAFDEGMAGLYQEFDNTANDLTARGKKFYEDLGYVFDEAESEGIFDGLSDSWVSTLMDMSKTAEDWANEVGKMIAEQIIKQMVVPTMIQPLIDNLQEVFKAAMDAATTTDENGNKSYDWDAVLNNNGLMAALNALSEKYPEIQSVIKHIMDALGLDTSNYKYDGFSNLADSIIDSLKSAEGSIDDWANEQGKKMAEQMAQAYIDTHYGEQINKLNEEWQQALEAGDADRMKEIEDALRSLYAAMGDDQNLRNLVDMFKELAENPFKDMADDFASSLMDMEQSAEDFANNIAKTLMKQMINKVITEQYQSRIDALGEEWREALEKGDTAAIERIRQQLIALREEIGSAVQPLLDAISDLDNQIDYTLQDMKSTFASALMDMTASTQDFADNISKIMAQAFIEKFVLGDAFDKRMEEWQKRYEYYLTSGINEEERMNGLKALRDEIAAAGNDYTRLSNEILDLFGLTASSDQEATMNMSDKITYDQADQLLGINLAQELTLEQILATLRDDSLDYTPTFDSLTGASAVNEEQSKLILATIQNMAAMMQDRQDGILTQVAMANSHLQLIRDYSKSIRDEVVMHLGSMDSKLSNLRNL